jgi:ATP-dependent DNA ligase
MLLNEHIAEDGATVFAHAYQLVAEGIVSKAVDGTYRSGPCRVWIKIRNPPASACSGSGARFGIGDPWLAVCEAAVAHIASRVNPFGISPIC